MEPEKLRTSEIRLVAYLKLRGASIVETNTDKRARYFLMSCPFDVKKELDTYDSTIRVVEAEVRQIKDRYGITWKEQYG